MSSRLGIDVGGTFTDLLLFDESSGAMRLLKTPSTPSDQSVGILEGIQQLVAETGITASSVTALLHGTTVSTNIVLEAKGAKVGLLVTENFEQVLHLARSQTPGPLAGWIIMQKPDPLADLELTRGIRERADRCGASAVLPASFPHRISGRGKPGADQPALGSQRAGVRLRQRPAAG